MIAQILGFITFYGAVVIFLAEILYLIKSLTTDQSKKRFYWGLLIILISGTAIFISKDCYNKISFFDLNSGKIKESHYYFNFQLSEEVTQNSFSKTYKSCRGSRNKPKWIKTGSVSGPFIMVMSNEYGFVIRSIAQELIAWSEYKSPVDEKQKCRIMKEYLNLVDAQAPNRATNLAGCFEIKIKREPNPSEQTISKISRECLDKY